MRTTDPLGTLLRNGAYKTWSDLGLVFFPHTQSRFTEVDGVITWIEYRIITTGDRRVLPECLIPFPPKTPKASRGGGGRVRK